MDQTQADERLRAWGRWCKAPERREPLSQLSNWFRSNRCEICYEDVSPCWRCAKVASGSFQGQERNHVLTELAVARLPEKERELLRDWYVRNKDERVIRRVYGGGRREQMEAALGVAIGRVMMFLSITKI